MSKRTLDETGRDEQTPRRRKVYISGPMTGLPEHNFPAFNAAAEMIRDTGAEVVNPAEINVPGTGVWSDYMRADIKQLCDCCSIYMLDGWMSSKGAYVEFFIARELGMKIYFER